jgi:hypothetical protein
MNELLRAKCKLYMELLDLYSNDEAEAIAEDDILLMDALMKNKEVKAYLQSKLS